MVNRKIALLLLFVVTLAASFKVFGQARRVDRLTIHESGVSLNQKDEMMVSWCKNFKPTSRQVRNFFLKSYPVPGAYMIDDYYSDCYASGEISFNDNKSFGKWTLYSTGVAKIEWELGGEVYLLYRKNGWRDPMAE